MPHVPQAKTYQMEPCTKCNMTGWYEGESCNMCDQRGWFIRCVTIDADDIDTEFPQLDEPE